MHRKRAHAFGDNCGKTRAGATGRERSLEKRRVLVDGINYAAPDNFLFLYQNSRRRCQIFLLADVFVLNQSA